MANDLNSTAAEGVTYTQSAGAEDAERRLSGDATPGLFLTSVKPNPKAEDGFVGVGFEYQNFANDTDKPLAAEEGVDKKLEDLFSKAIESEPQEGPEAYRDAYRVASRSEDELEAEVKESAPSAAGGQATTTSPEPSETEGKSVSGGTPSESAF